MTSPPSSAAGAGDAAASGDDAPRVKFLCSFGGTILPRPLDSRLRYVGGETRIVSVPRHASFADLLARLRLLFDSPTPLTIKYQQPDEDLDALVSVVNHDDVLNLMDEYDKLGADAFTRLRIFLFSSHDPVSFSADDRETERRYIDALNDAASPPSPENFHRPWSPAAAAAYFSPSPSPRYDYNDYVDNNVNVGFQSGFPSNLGHAHNVFDGGSVCEHCRMGFRGGPVVHVDPRWKQPPLDSCAECNYIPHHHPEARREQHYAADANGMNVSFSNGNFYDAVPYEDVRYLRPGAEVGGEMFHVQPAAAAGSPQAHFSGFDDMGARYGNRPPAYAADNLYQVAQNLPPIQSIRRKAQLPMRPGTSYESSGLMVPNGGMGSGFNRSPSPQDVSPRMSRMAMENQIQNSWAGQNGSASQKMQGFDGAGPEYFYDHGSRSNRIPEHVPHGVMYADVPYEGVPLAPTMVDDKFMASTAFGYHPFAKMNGAEVAPQICVEKNTVVEACEAQQEDIGKEDDMQASPSLSKLKNLHVDVNKLKPADGNCNSPKVVIADADATTEQGGMSAECLSILPDLIASVKKAALETAEVVKARAEANADEDVSAIPEKMEASKHELEPENAIPELVSDSDRDGEHQKISKIESTTAESEALAKGLQTIRNDDLEEIRQLGSGTYGSVFHGKWKGSDVAIKRIKASCFAGRPSERERLIADFWKEALILSSLHHPNVVSFYGVVRDGPDGSLATVTEFMVNGSLKQFLQKKDRTIDRRKRLIIAMDAAFGMEYLHGKNIVHFDLKCENLLVNMRDPHRPICKIGDLGLSKVKQHTLVSGGVRGTLPWMAPELLSGKCHMVTEKIDVYSFGIVMWELLTGEDPYADMHCASMIGGIVNNTLRPQIPTWCDPEWKALMESCWSSEPGERPSFAEISQKLRKMAAAINLK